MLQLLLLLAVTQAPAVPGETTLVSFCKQGRLSACQTLRQVDPQAAAEAEAAAKSALRLVALKAAEEEAREQEDAKAAEAEGEADPESPDCQGQNHHAISRPIAEELERHKTLRGLYGPRDERFKTQAKDKESHCGYQRWHREVDAEVIAWLRKWNKATPKEFENFLRELYNRPAMRKRFPNGL